MGKHRKPSGKNAELAKADADLLPSFDEKALSALTERIEKGFDKPNAPQKLGGTGRVNDKKDKQTKGKNPEHNRGTKRDAQGNAKAAGKGKAEGSSRDKKSKHGVAKDDRDTLLKEILALGGTEEDLDLVAGAASDDDNVEGDNGPAQDKSFKKDLAKFVAGLGIEGTIVEDASEPEAENDEKGEEVWEEASDLDSPEEYDVPDEPEELPKKLAPGLPDANITDVSSKGPSRLVSMSPL